ncbi:RNA polymerase sigma factor [Algoriphagus halophytocola]|uniref:RNA polymerase sigma factor n=1 Tax=Algoriphagus halophytocola TaxID=2991499 RepID=A0ABY6MBX2_9BACT|nr:RNA polymerase sigma-70 factor [Algoriphagus sp. TR-M5]UZD21143.1 RNA polymerase sigma-70 factor [Algoriphagus sp. TR-M5]
MSVQKDSDLVEELRKGNVKAYRTLFQEFYDSLCLFANKYLQDFDNSEDIVQEAFITVWDYRKDINSYASLKSFLYTVTKNKCLSFLKNNARKNDLLNGASFFTEMFYEANVVEEETYRLLEKGIKELPDQSRKIIQLHLEGFKNQEIADELNISINTVKTLKKNAYKNLREIIGVFAILFLDV